MTTPLHASQPRMGTRGLVLALLVPLLILAVSCADDSGLTGPADEPRSDPGDFIVFASDRGGETTESGRELVDIYRVHLDGTGVVNLTSHPTQLYSDLHLSPDRSTLLFRSDREGCYDLWSMPPDTVEPTQLTGPGERCNTRPRWSPDGSMIAFTTSRNQSVWEVYVMASDGSAPRNVSDDYLGGTLISTHVHGWTPDGRVVLFRPVEEGHQTLVVNPDGSGLGPLFEGFEQAVMPYWSPDGSRVAFHASVDGTSSLHLGNGDATGIHTVSGGPATLGVGSWGQPVDPWSPDGGRLVVNGDGDLYRMDADASGLVTLTTGEGSNLFHGWSPDGTRILFSSDRSGTWDLYLINADGTNLERITDGEGDDRWAVWVSRGG